MIAELAMVARAIEQEAKKFSRHVTRNMKLTAEIEAVLQKAALRGWFAAMMAALGAILGVLAPALRHRLGADGLADLCLAQSAGILVIFLLYRRKARALEACEQTRKGMVFRDPPSRPLSGTRMI